MPKGTYYVGDMAHVLPADLWDGVSNEAGQYTLSDGREVLCFTFEGSQLEKENDPDFYVESGMIGITLLAGLEKDWRCPTAVFGGWGPHWNKMQALSNPRKVFNMVDYMTLAGQIVVYYKDFECMQTTLSHYKHDDHSTTTYFGENVSIWTLHGHYNSVE